MMVQLHSQVKASNPLLAVAAGSWLGAGAAGTIFDRFEPENQVDTEKKARSRAVRRQLQELLGLAAGGVASYQLAKHFSRRLLPTPAPEINTPMLPQALPAKPGGSILPIAVTNRRGGIDIKQPFAEISPRSVLQHTYGPRLTSVIAEANAARKAHPEIKVLQRIPDAKNIDTDKAFNRRIPVGLMNRNGDVLAQYQRSSLPFGLAWDESILVGREINDPTLLHHETTHAMQRADVNRSISSNRNIHDYFNQQTEVEAYVSAFNAKHAGKPLAERLKIFDQEVSKDPVSFLKDSRQDSNSLLAYLAIQNIMQGGGRGLGGILTKAVLQNDKWAVPDARYRVLRDRARRLIPLIVQNRGTNHVKA